MKKSFKSLFPNISTIAVLLALIIISIFQYNWVVSSAATDISELYRSLTVTITNKIVLELSDKPLFNKIVSFVKYTRSDNEILSELKLLSESFYDSNDKYFELEIFQVDLNSHNIYKFEGDNWAKETISMPIIDHVLKSVNSDQSHIFLNDIIWQALPIKGSTNRLVLLKIDTFAYYKEKIIENSKQILNNYELVIYDSLPSNGSYIDGQGYKYSPFSRKQWFSVVPIPIIVFPGIEMREPNVNPMDRNIPRPPRDNDKLIRDAIFIDILDNGIPLVTKKENYLTMQWILNLLLLIGIGTGYFIIYLQVVRLRDLRSREKEFTATITHELRTPLTVIQSAADNIEGGFLSNSRVKEYGKLITDQSLRLGSMIEGILLFSRLEGRAEKPPILSRVFYQDIKITLETFAKSLMDTSNNVITINFDELPISSITDKDTIELILTNLISNSNKHAYDISERGNINVYGSINSDNELKFIVEDQGFGIEKSEKKLLFDPFFRGKRSHKKQVKGSGLGLFLSNKKANLLGGKLEYIRKNSSGAAFGLIIPYIKG